MIRNVAAIIFTVRDLNKACDFYQNKLELELKYKNNKTGWAEFDINGLRFSLKQNQPFGNGSNPIVSLYTENLERTVDKYKNKGVKFTDGGTIKSEFYGNTINLEDPDGNIINLFESAR